MNKNCIACASELPRTQRHHFGPTSAWDTSFRIISPLQLLNKI